MVPASTHSVATTLPRPEQKKKSFESRSICNVIYTTCPWSNHEKMMDDLNLGLRNASHKEQSNFNSGTLGD
ncbi:MAG: hypothetical protein CM1200mP18_09190 [Gammaproteobacteria bacterium]|nr:MAG: hypothetical protein CM1200mP18_09190 [Gammaproteobacteria bacterium]